MKPNRYCMLPAIDHFISFRKLNPAYLVTNFNLGLRFESPKRINFWCNFHFELKNVFWAGSILPITTKCQNWILKFNNSISFISISAFQRCPSFLLFVRYKPTHRHTTDANSKSGIFISPGNLEKKALFLDLEKIPTDSKIVFLDLFLVAPLQDPSSSQQQSVHPCMLPFQHACGRNYYLG